MARNNKKKSPWGKPGAKKRGTHPRCQTEWPLKKSLREIRTENSLTLETMSSLTGMSPSLLSRIERGVRNTPIALCALYRILEKINPADFLILAMPDGSTDKKTSPQLIKKISSQIDTLIAASKESD